MTRRRPFITRTPWLPLQTERLILREIREADFDDLHAYGSDPEVSRFMTWGPNTPEVTRQVLDRWLAEQASWPRSSVNMGVEVRAERRLIGSIRLDLVAEAARTVEFGYTLSRLYWNRGIATEAMRALLGVAFEDLGARRIIATCDVRNGASWRVMEKLGMRREAHFIQDVKGRRGWRDSYLYALLAREWRAAAA